MCERVVAVSSMKTFLEPACCSHASSVIPSFVTCTVNYAFLCPKTSLHDMLLITIIVLHPTLSAQNSKCPLLVTLYGRRRYSCGPNDSAVISSSHSLARLSMFRKQPPFPVIA